MKEEYRPEGRYITAVDVSDRLMPDLFIHEVMLWAPDLFAYTSYILTMTSAYQLVVSPPAGKCWQPNEEEIRAWLVADLAENLRYWLTDVQRDWDQATDVKEEQIAEIVGSVSSRIDNFCDDSKKPTDPTRPEEGTTFWEALVQRTGEDWQLNLGKLKTEDFDLIDDTVVVGQTRESLPESLLAEAKKKRQKQLRRIVLGHCPDVLLACWAFFYRQATDCSFYRGAPLQLTELLCNQDCHRDDPVYTDKLWRVAQSVLTMHAIADIASVSFGVANNPADFPKKQSALQFAERLLFGRCKGLYRDTMFFGGGSLSTFNTERVRILPKRHNPGVGITLRSISSNLAFHQSSVDVVWRKAKNNPLADRLSTRPDEHPTDEVMSILLLPFPEIVRTDEFGIVPDTKWLSVSEPVSKLGHRYFSYEQSPERSHAKMARIEKVINAAREEWPAGLDMIVLPEAALTVGEFKSLEDHLNKAAKKAGKVKDEYKEPNILIAGVMESPEEVGEELGLDNTDPPQVYFSRNAVYCKYYDAVARSYDVTREASSVGECLKKSPLKEKFVTPKYKQYKHHRWQLNESQISRYGLSNRLVPENRLWWEAIKVPKRRVSFLNVGNRLTISHLICEDLARQDPIAELIRHVGPSIVVAILMDGPQLKNRWSARYATVLADDPGCSVITLTSFGMVKRDTSPYGSLSRVIGLWNDSEGKSLREIELASGARGVLLTVKLVKKREKTADGRKEKFDTSIARLQDVIQIYDA